MQTLERHEILAKERAEQIGIVRGKGGLLARFPVSRFLSSAHESEAGATVDVERKEGQIVFVDGQFSPTLSHVPNPCVLLSMKQAYLSYGALLQQRMQDLGRENNPFALSSLSFLSQGAFLYIPPREELAQPLTVLHVCSGKGPRHMNLKLFLGAGARAGVVVRSFGESNWINHSIVGSVEAGGDLELVSMPEQAAWASTAVRFDIKRESKLKVHTFSTGTQGSHFDTQVRLLEENSQAYLFGLSHLDAKESHVRCEMRHKAPHCMSNQHIKSIGREGSVFSFNGNIYVDRIAQKTDAYQMNNNLLLCDSARAYSKPGLEIFADDVKASHGSTTGQLREEELLYLAARGIGAQQAMQLLVNAFAKEMIDQVAIAEVGHELERKMLG